MKEILSKYKIEVIAIAAILGVMFIPYIIISTSVLGLVSSAEKLESIDTLIRELTGPVIGALCIFLVYRAIKRNREDR